MKIKIIDIKKDYDTEMGPYFEITGAVNDGTISKIISMNVLEYTEKRAIKLFKKIVKYRIKRSKKVEL